ncbi:MAG: hypothetical protein PF517_18115 [Salinivirgaceae bacterium]|jgi:hypothetical protein|nr:hypothetical protein [Salinivirgaceae bacterium]
MSKNLSVKRFKKYSNAMKGLLMLSMASFLLLNTAVCQKLNAGLIGLNYWMPSWEHNGRIEQVWDQVIDLNPELIRIGGNACRGTYYGIEKYDEMLDSIQSVGSIPLVQISGRWSYEQRRALLTHFKESNRNILYFSINNEDDDDKFEGWLQEAVQEHITISEEIRKVFPDAIIAGPAFKGFDPREIANHEFFLKHVLNKKDKNGKFILSIYDMHTYTTSFTPEGEPKYDISVFKKRIEPILALLDSVNSGREDEEKVSWMLSEININYKNEGEIWIHKGRHSFPETHKAYSFYAGQYWTQMFGFGIEKGAFAMVPWSVHESEGSRVSLDLGMFDNDTAPFIPRSTYHHMKMLRDNLKQNSIKSIVSKDDVEVVAMTDSTGSTVIVMNTGINAYSLQVSLNLSAEAKSICSILVDAGIKKQIKDVLEGETTKCYAFDPNGKLISKWSYSHADADAENPRTIVIEVLK